MVKAENISWYIGTVEEWKDLGVCVSITLVCVYIEHLPLQLYSDKRSK